MVNCCSITRAKDNLEYQSMSRSVPIWREFDWAFTQSIIGVFSSPFWPVDLERGPDQCPGVRTCVSSWLLLRYCRRTRSVSRPRYVSSGPRFGAIGDWGLSGLPVSLENILAPFRCTTRNRDELNAPWVQFHDIGDLTQFQIVGMFSFRLLEKILVCLVGIQLL